jgi:hypothetical protein
MAAPILGKREVRLCRVAPAARYREDTSLGLVEVHFLLATLLLAEPAIRGMFGNEQSIWHYARFRVDRMGGQRKNLRHGCGGGAADLRKPPRSRGRGQTHTGGV